MSIAEAIPQTTEQLIPLELLDANPNNPRKIFKGIDELADDMKKHGLIHAVMARPKGDRFELVVGERRKRAAKVAGFEAIRATVREMSDAEALEIAVIENGQRADVHELEEADGYEALHAKHGYTVEQIAAKVGKSVAYVYGRMKLLALCPEARKAFYEGKLDASRALLVARIPVPKLQKDFVAEIVETKNEEAVSYREAVRIVQNKYMLRLAGAPFDKLDANLVDGAPACAKCPNRTGNQPELFDDVKSPDLCTDPSCFALKKEAAWSKRVEGAKASGQKVLSKAETKKAFPHDYSSALANDSGFVSLDEKNYSDPKTRTYRQLLGKNVPTTTLARDATGKVHELVPKGLFAKAAKEAGIDLKKSSSSDNGQDRYAAEQKKKKVETAIMKEVERAVMAKVVEAALTTQPDAAFALLLTRAVLRTARIEEAAAVLARRELTDEKRGALETIDKQLDKMGVTDLRGLLVELLASHGGVHTYSQKLGENLRDFAALYKVDAKKIEAGLRAQVAAKEAEKKAAARDKAKGKKAPAKKKGPKP